MEAARVRRSAAGCVLLVTNVVAPLARLIHAFGTAGILRVPSALLRAPELSLPLDEEGRMNVLLLGLGWGSDGTDTILLASMDPKSDRAALLSIPRDLVVSFPDGPDRINQAYRIGESRSPGSGGAFARGAVGGVLGLEVPRFALVDIDGLRAIVDDVNGVPVAADRAFTDQLMPDSAFDAGWQWLSGERALAFMRARHGDHGESTDFARVRRQQKVVLAVKDRLFSPTVALNPLTVHRLVGHAIGSITTDLRAEEITALLRSASRLQSHEVQRISLADEGLVVEMRGTEGAYNLQPAGGSC